MFEREIVDYRLVAGDHKWVAEKVPEFIKDGWQPFGGVTHVMSSSGLTEKYAQAMVRYAKDDLGEVAT